MPSPVALAAPSPPPDAIESAAGITPTVISPASALLEMMMNSEDLQSMVASPPLETHKPVSFQVSPAGKRTELARTPSREHPKEAQEPKAAQENASQSSVASRLHAVACVMRAAHNHDYDGLGGELWEAGEEQEMALQVQEMQGKHRIQEEAEAAAALERKQMRREAVLGLEALDAAADAKEAALLRVQTPHRQARVADPEVSADAIAVAAVDHTAQKKEAERDAAFRRELLEKEAADLAAKEAAKRAIMELKALDMAVMEKEAAQEAATDKVKREAIARVVREKEEEAHATAEHAAAELQALEVALACVNEVKAAASAHLGVETHDTVKDEQESAVTEEMTSSKVGSSEKDARTLYSSVSDILAHAKATFAQKAAAKLPPPASLEPSKDDFDTVSGDAQQELSTPKTPKEEAVLRGKKLFAEKLAAASASADTVGSSPVQISATEHQPTSSPLLATPYPVSSGPSTPVATTTAAFSTVTQDSTPFKPAQDEANVTPQEKPKLPRRSRAAATSAGGFWGGADDWLRKNSASETHSSVGLRQAMSLVGKVSRLLGASVGIGLITTFHAHCEGDLEFGKLPLGCFFKLWRKAGVVSEVGHAELLHVFADYVEEPSREDSIHCMMDEADEEGVTLCGFLRALPTIAEMIKPNVARIDAMASLLRNHLLPLAESCSHGSSRTTPEKNRTGEFSTGCLARMEKVLDDPRAVNVFVRRGKDISKLLGRYDGRPEGSSVTRTRLDALARMAQDVAITPELLTQRDLAALFQLEIRSVESSGYKAPEGLSPPQLICMLLRAAAVAYPELEGPHAANALLAQMAVPTIGMSHRSRAKGCPAGTPKGKASPRLRSSPGLMGKRGGSPSRHKVHFPNSNSEASPKPKFSVLEASPKSKVKVGKRGKEPQRDGFWKAEESSSGSKPGRQTSPLPSLGRNAGRSPQRKTPPPERLAASPDQTTHVSKGLASAPSQSLGHDTRKGDNHGEEAVSGIVLQEAEGPEESSFELHENTCIAFTATEPPEPPPKKPAEDYGMLLKKRSSSRDPVRMSEPAKCTDKSSEFEQQEPPNRRGVAQSEPEADWKGDTSVCLNFAPNRTAHNLQSESPEVNDNAWQDVDVMSNFAESRNTGEEADEMIEEACKLIQHATEYTPNEEVEEEICDESGPGNSPVLRVLHHIRRNSHCPPPPVDSQDDSKLKLDLNGMKKRQEAETASPAETKEATSDDDDDEDDTHLMSIVRKAAQKATESSAEPTTSASPRCVRMSNAFDALLHGDVPPATTPNVSSKRELPEDDDNQETSPMFVSVSPLSQTSPSASPRTPNPLQSYSSMRRDQKALDDSAMEYVEVPQTESGNDDGSDGELFGLEELDQDLEKQPSEVETRVQAAQEPAETGSVRVLRHRLSQHSKALRLIFNYYCKKDRSASSWDTGVSAQHAQGQVLMQTDLERLARHLDLFPALCSKRVLTTLFNEARKESTRGAKPFGGLNFNGFRLWLAYVMDQSGEKSEAILKRIANSQGIRKLEAALDARSGSLAAQFRTFHVDPTSFAHFQTGGKHVEGSKALETNSPRAGEQRGPLAPQISNTKAKVSRAVSLAKEEAVLEGHGFGAHATTLKRIFVAYADSCPGRKTVLQPGELRFYDEAVLQKASISRRAYLRFAQDFNLMPGLVSRVEIDRIFSAPLNNIRDIDGELSMHQDHGRRVGSSLHFDLYSLAASLQGVAHIGFAKPCNCLGSKIQGLPARSEALFKLMRESSGVGRVEALERAVARVPRSKTRSNDKHRVPASRLEPLFTAQFEPNGTGDTWKHHPIEMGTPNLPSEGETEDDSRMEGEKPPPPPAPPPLKMTPSMGQIFCDKVVKDTVAGRLAAAACWRSEQQTKLRGIFEANTAKRDLLGLPRMNEHEFCHLLYVMRFSESDEEGQDHRSYFSRAVSQHDQGSGATISYTEFVEATIELFAHHSHGSHRKLRTEVEITQAADTFARVLMEQHIAGVGQEEKQHPAAGVTSIQSTKLGSSASGPGVA